MATAEDPSPGPVTALDAGGPNAIAVSNGLVGDEWTLWIVEQALHGTTQYNEWLRAGPISSSVLTARLASLVEAGILERTQYRARPPRYDYRLTSRGRQMWPILLLIWAWERTWADGSAHSLPQMQHTACGQLFSPVLVCDVCDQPADPREVIGRFGPSGSWQRSIPAAATRRRAHSGDRPQAVIPQTMALIGNRWSMALLGSAFMGASRFGQFEQRMGAPPTIVAERLRTFCNLGVLVQKPNKQRPDWMTYRLSAKGRAFFPVVVAVVVWGQRWFHAPEGPALLLQHRSCRRSFRPRLLCSACGESLRGHAVEVIRLDDAYRAGA